MQKKFYFIHISVVFILINTSVIVCAQNVGIGTTTPAVPLHLKSTTASDILRIDGNNPYISFFNAGLYKGYLWHDGSKLVLGTPNTDPIVISSGYSVGTTFTSGGFVGINKTNPSERLDINGNVNVSGTIKANGVDGQPNQVLMKNNSGSLTWGDMCEFKEYVTFGFTSIGAVQTWTVPAGVTKIRAEVWGGGGGGSCFAGGGGGGYITGYFTVTPGTSVSLVVGANGNGSPYGSTLNNDGDDSRFTAAGVTITAIGGYGSYLYNVSNNSGWLGRGGAFIVSTPTFKNWEAVSGEDGQPNQVNYLQPNTATYCEAILGGNGGNAGNTTQTGGGGGYYLYNVTVSYQLRYIPPGFAKIPGGGGAANANNNPSFSGGPGNSGLVIIHY